MTLAVPILALMGYIAGSILYVVMGIINLFTYLLARHSIMPLEQVVDPGSPEDWRVVRKFLFLPLVRLDNQGWDWLDYRPVYQSYVWRGGSEGGMVWVDQWVVTSSHDPY